MKLKNLNNLLLFCGSSITLVVGLLAAFIPGLAYVTVISHFVGLPSVHYLPLSFSAHLLTMRLFVSAISGLIGLLAMFWKNKQSYIGALAITVASLGFMLPATGDMRLTNPMTRLFDVPWAGSFLVLVGICLIFLGLTIKKPNVPRATFLSVPLLLVAYSIHPLFVLSNFLPWIVFGAIMFNNPINWLMWFLMLAGHLIMMWAAIKGSLPNRQRKEQGT
jgi:hypothetical protein